MASSSWGRRLAPVGLLVLSSAVAVGLAEGALRLVLNPSDFLHATLVDDPVLGHRIAPGTSGHDALGYRNATVPSQVRVVAIGDSNTYGVSAPREGSWPQQLAGLLGEPVYNMGLGGFGPLQYLHLTQTTVRELKPRVIVLGFYFGNDLMDAHLVAHGRPHWHAWRLAGNSPAGAGAVQGARPEAPQRRFQAVRDWLSRHSLLYSVLRATVFQRLAAQEREALVQRSAPDERWSWSDPARPDTRTVFTPQLRLASLDLDRPAVREGLQISQRALVQIQAETRRQGVQLLTLLIPTKERAYCGYLRASGAALPAAHRRLCDAETLAKTQLQAFLDTQGITHVDATPALEARIAAHAQLYPADADGHAVSAGYGVMAGVVADALARLGPKP